MWVSVSLSESVAGETMQYKKISDVPAEKWQELAKKNIYFGHQSVGFNIIDGIKLVEQEYPEIKLHIVEGRSLDKNDGVLLHSRVGENTKPETKINDFVNVIDHELGVIPDAAALKFCYVDANDNVNVRKIFDQYKKAMARLREEHPGLIIIHFTMPLRTQPISWKARLKSIIGREPWEFKDNIKRNQFNQLLLAEYQDKEPVFDIAGYESTEPNGRKKTFEYKGSKYAAMVPAYSSDGGHLNQTGQKWIAENLLLLLANTL